MTKNLTLSIPDETYSLMEKFPEVNWSAVAKSSIQTYIEMRMNPDLAAAIEKLLQQKGAQYAQGRTRAQEITEKGADWRAFEIFMKRFREKQNEVAEIERKEIEHTSGETKPTSVEGMKSFLLDEKLIDEKVSDEYIKGIWDGLVAIEKSITKP